MKHIPEPHRAPPPEAWGGPASQPWPPAGPDHHRLSGAVSLYFRNELFRGFLIDRLPDRWLAVTGLWSRYRIHRVSLAAPERHFLLRLG